MKHHPIILLLILLPLLLVSQGVTIYEVSRQTGITYNSISASGLSVSSWRAGANQGDNRSFPVPIGFSFNYLGTVYTQANISLNGFIDFSSNTSAGVLAYPYGYENNYFSVPIPDGTLLAIAPFYEDVMCSVGSSLSQSIKYRTTGTTGNRVFTVEWINMTYYGTDFTQKVSFQVKLYEADGDIEFNYGNMAAEGIALSYTCGINTETMSVPPGVSQLLTQQYANSAVFNENEQNALSAIPESNSRILFDGCILPSAAGPITGITNTCGGSTGITYSIQPVTGATGYQWTLPSGFTITSGATTASIMVDIAEGASSGVITASGTNSCGSGGASTLGMTVNIRPVPTISGSSSACQGTTGLAYTTQTGMTNYQWGISPGGTILSGGNTNAIIVTWNQGGPQYVEVNYTNSTGCNAAAPVNYPVAIDSSTTPVVSGPASVCVTSTGNLYAAQPGMSNYQWIVSTGGAITAGGTSTSNSVEVTWTTTGSKSVIVNFTNPAGCTSATPTTYPVTVNPIPYPVLFGPNTACAGTSGNIYTTQSGMVNYTWNISSGGVITSPTNSNQVAVTWNTAGQQTISVNYTTPAGCTGLLPNTLPVTVNTPPVPTIAGPAVACEATGGHLYTTQSGMSNYQWGISIGGTILSGQGTNTISVIWNYPGNQIVTVNYTNASGCNALAPASYPVTIHPQPSPSLTGPNPVCQGSGGNTYTTETGMTNYIWDVSAGNTITGGGTSGDNYVTVIWNESGSQDIMVNYTNANGCFAQSATTLPVQVNPGPQPSITGIDTLCINASGIVYSTQPGMNSYSWNLTSGGTITGGTGTSAITVNWTGSGNQIVSVNYMDGNGCSANLPAEFFVYVSPLPVPTITGPASGCQGVSGTVYATEAGMSNYQWVVSTGGTITAGGTSLSNTVTVTWNSLGAQSVSVSYTNSTGCTPSTPTVYPVTVYELPLPTITGATIACVNSGNYPYATETGMTGYQWAVSPSGMITGGVGTAQIQVSWIGSGAQWVSVNYTNANGCPAASATTLAITVEPVPGATGTITGDDELCAGSSGVAYSVAPVSHATSYIWTLPPGATIASGAGTNTITVDYTANASSGNLTVTGVNTCGNGPPSPSFPVFVTPKPPAPVITQSGDILLSNAPAGNQWFRDGNPIPDATGPTYLATENGEYWDRVTLNGCSSDTSNHLFVVVTATSSHTGTEATIYPNPGKGNFIIRFRSPVDPECLIKVISPEGVVVRELTLRIHPGSNTAELNLAPIPAGIYALWIQSRDVQTIRKIVVTP